MWRWQIESWINLLRLDNINIWLVNLYSKLSVSNFAKLISIQISVERYTFNFDKRNSIGICFNAKFNMNSKEASHAPPKWETFFSATNNMYKFRCEICSKTIIFINSNIYFVCRPECLCLFLYLLSNLDWMIIIFEFNVFPVCVCCKQSSGDCKNLKKSRFDEKGMLNAASENHPQNSIGWVETSQPSRRKSWK